MDNTEHHLEWTGERILPEDGRYMFRRHLQAYQFSMDYCEKKVILDAGCGEGYGSYILAGRAAGVVGIDISQEAIGHARKKYIRDNLEYQVMDVSHTGFADETFDAVVSFQVIEHLDSAGAFLKEVRRVLKNGGMAFISTPNKSLCSGQATGKFHTKEWRHDEFVDLLHSYFDDVQCYGVHLKSGKDSFTVRFLDLAVKWDILRLRRLFSPALRKNVYVSMEKTVSLEITKERPLKYALDIIGACKKA
jgi:SAM-dependent methyltransferase